MPLGYRVGLWSAVVVGFTIASAAWAQSPVEGEAPATQPATTDGASSADEDLKEGAAGNREAPVQPVARMRYPGPQVDDTDAVLLMHYARRAMRFAVRGKPWEGDRYEPTSLASLRGVVYLRLWRNGISIADAESEETTIVEGTISAATVLGAKLKQAMADERGRDAGLGLQFEFMAEGELVPPPYFNEGGTWTEALLGAMEPGFHAIGVTFDGKSARTRAAQIIESNFSPDLALVAAESQVGLGPEEKKTRGSEARYYRYASVHFHQPDARSQPVRLLRGEALVPPEAVTREGVGAALSRVGDYLRYRHNSNGSFSHEYLPSGDKYFEANNASVQLRSLYGLTRYAAHTNSDADEQAVAGSMEVFSKYLEELEFQLGASGQRVDTTGGLILFFPGHEDHLETSAFLLMSMATAPDHGRYEPQMRGLTQSLKLAGFSDGSIRLVPGEAPQGPPTAADDRAAAVTVAALAQRYALTKDPEIDLMLMSTLAHFEARGDAIGSETAAWLVRGYARQYEQTGQPRYERYVFEMADRFVLLQLDERNCPYPALRGAINVQRAGAVGARSAIYIAALADALRIARRTGDAERAAAYEDAVRRGMRFLMQLEFVEAEAYFVRSKLDTLGGIRTAPWNVRLRADHCADAVDALIAGQRALYP